MDWKKFKTCDNFKRWEDPKTRNDNKCSGKKWDLNEVDKKTIDLYMGEHTEDRGKTSENDVSEVIPVKEPDEDGLLPALFEVVNGFQVCF